MLPASNALEIVMLMEPLVTGSDVAGALIEPSAAMGKPQAFDERRDAALARGQGLD
jgi:hypothetical protein